MADDHKKKEKPERPKKKPWVHPTIKTGKLFESNSLACGKNITTDPDNCGAVGPPNVS